MLPYHVDLDEQPSVVVYVDEWKFLVGTYMLKEVALPACDLKNHRAGSLLLFAYSDIDKNYHLTQSISCDQGGVFDLAVHDKLIRVAHANNAVASYHFGWSSGDLSVDRNHIEYSGTAKLLSEDFTILLTSIDLCKLACGKLYAAVADSDGRVTILSVNHLDGDKILDKTYVMDDTEAKAPVWQVRFVQPTKGEMTDLDRLFMISCCENGTWNVLCFHVKTDRIEKLNTGKFKHHSVGVTSVLISRPPQDPSPTDGGMYLEVTIGSYDETIKRYKLRMVVMYGKVQIKKTLIEDYRIEGAGIWRLVQKNGELYMANMYAGCHKASMEGKIASTIVSLTEQILSGSKITKRPLLYGIDVAPDGVACVADFNNKAVYFANCTKRLQNPSSES